ncbi:MAG: carbohydrate-binding domain-containing protein, partial [Oscillospiraceae bacterium]|nr:carbohydrate-binding domain-containing protein [Oscillospiraceae bacterium]
MQHNRFMIIALAAFLLLSVSAGCASKAAADANATASPSSGTSDAPETSPSPTDGAGAWAAGQPPYGSAGIPAAISSPVPPSPVPSPEIKPEDTNTAVPASSATKITLSGTSAAVSGAGAAAKGGVVTISAAGTYSVSGKLTNGSLVIAAGKDDTVRIILDGAEITNPAGAAIYASKCGKLIISLADGKSNAVTDGGAAFVYADVAEEEPNAAIFSKGDLTINGSGSLTV